MCCEPCFITVAGESAYATAVQAPEIHGPPKYYTVDWDAARGSIERLAALRPERVVTGHGRALHGSDMHRGLDALAQNFDRLAVPEHGRYVASPAHAEDGSAYRKP